MEAREAREVRENGYYIVSIVDGEERVTHLSMEELADMPLHSSIVAEKGAHQVRSSESYDVITRVGGWAGDAVYHVVRHSVTFHPNKRFYDTELIDVIVL